MLATRASRAKTLVPRRETDEPRPRSGCRWAAARVLGGCMTLASDCVACITKLPLAAAPLEYLPSRCASSRRHALAVEEGNTAGGWIFLRNNITLRSSVQSKENDFSSFADRAGWVHSTGAYLRSLKRRALQSYVITLHFASKPTIRARARGEGGGAENPGRATTGDHQLQCVRLIPRGQWHMNSQRCSGFRMTRKRLPRCRRHHRAGQAAQERRGVCDVTDRARCSTRMS